MNTSMSGDLLLFATEHFDLSVYHVKDAIGCDNDTFIKIYANRRIVNTNAIIFVVYSEPFEQQSEQFYAISSNDTIGWSYIHNNIDKLDKRITHIS